MGRCFRRWLDKDQIEVCSLSGPLIQQALAAWGEYGLSSALDTSMLWRTYCLLRLAMSYRGRAVPLVWTGRKHGRAQVSDATDEDLLDRAA
jgi:hypothetical protein